MHRQRGLTLLELLVVLAIIALATAGVSLSLRDNAQTQLEREAQRLIAVLEATRAHSRTSGVVMAWQPTPEGFAIQTLPARPNRAATPHTWLQASTQATLPSATATVVLGPEPIIPAARITLSQASLRLTVGTDGLRPFAVLP
jgi:general secretion pathway protein H